MKTNYVSAYINGALVRFIVMHTLTEESLLIYLRCTLFLDKPVVLKYNSTDEYESMITLHT